MSAVRPLLLSLVVTVGLTGAAVYTWRDDEGQTHFGDRRPAGVDAEPVTSPPRLSEESAAEGAERLRRAQEVLRPTTGTQVAPVEPVDEAAVAEPHLPVSAELPCFGALADVVGASRADPFVPIVPTTLSPAAQRELSNLLRGLDGRWQGTFTERQCEVAAAPADEERRPQPAEAEFDWDSRRDRLVISLEYEDDRRRIDRRETRVLGVGEGLYFTDFLPRETVVLDGNRVEIIARHPRGVSFLLKRRMRTPVGAERVRVEVRRLVLSGGTLLLVELDYYAAALVVAREWRLARR